MSQRQRGTPRREPTPERLREWLDKQAKIEYQRELLALDDASEPSSSKRTTATSMTRSSEQSLAGPSSRPPHGTLPRSRSHAPSLSLTEEHYKQAPANPMGPPGEGWPRLLVVGPPVSLFDVRGCAKHQHSAHHRDDLTGCNAQTTKDQAASCVAPQAKTVVREPGCTTTTANRAGGTNR